MQECRCTLHTRLHPTAVALICTCLLQDDCDRLSNTPTATLSSLVKPTASQAPAPVQPGRINPSITLIRWFVGVVAALIVITALWLSKDSTAVACGIAGLVYAVVMPVKAVYSSLTQAAAVVINATFSTSPQRLVEPPSTVPFSPTTIFLKCAIALSNAPHSMKTRVCAGYGGLRSVAVSSSTAIFTRLLDCASLLLEPALSCLGIRELYAQMVVLVWYCMLTVALATATVVFWQEIQVRCDCVSSSFVVVVAQHEKKHCIAQVTTVCQ